MRIVAFVIGCLGAAVGCKHRPGRTELRPSVDSAAESVSAKRSPMHAAPMPKLESGSLPRGDATVRIAFFGDMGLGVEPERNLDMLVVLGVDLVVVLGDFDYTDSPDAWSKLMSRLGAIPWIAIAGNHDMPKFSEYSAVIAPVLLKHALRTGCVGEPGRLTSCGAHNVRIVLTESGTHGSPQRSEAFLERELSRAKEAFLICGWHKNQSDMQVGFKSDEVGYNSYQICQKYGALVVTGHEHSYARTRVLSEVGNTANYHGATGTYDDLFLGPGRTAVIVSGLGGKGIRPYAERFHDDDRWWAAYLTSNRSMRSGKSERQHLDQGYSGALVLDLGLPSQPDHGRGYFVLAQGMRIVDQFDVKRVARGSAE